MQRSKILLVIDVQKQFSADDGYEKCLKYIEEHGREYDRIIAFAFTADKEFANPLYEKHLNWKGLPLNIEKDIEFAADIIVPKSGYSTDAIGDAIYYSDIVDIIGCDADACVMATAFRLWDMRADFKILSDYIYTSAKDFSLEDVLKILKRNFGSCVA